MSNYLIKTYGCQANIVDSNALAATLEVLGFEPVEELSDTDLFIVNTCAVRQKSEDKVYGLGKVIRKLVESGGKKPVVVLAGCISGGVLSERARSNFAVLKSKTPWVDIYLSPDQLSQLPDILRSRGMLPTNAASVALVQRSKLGLKNPADNSGRHAYINISRGCDNFCTYCVVPYARGREVSRPRSEIMGELEELMSKGVTEVTLCGQNVNSWGLSYEEKFKIRSGSDQKLPFAELLREVCAPDGLKKVDFISSNPFDFTQDLVDMLKNPKIANYIHIAVQSGNNDVLRRMNRRHTVEEFIDLINRIKKVRPAIEIGTDAIVGFPGETRDQFMDTVKLFQTVHFAVAFISKYSPRQGTTAYKEYADDVSKEEKKWRHAHLTKVWKSCKAPGAKRKLPEAGVTGSLGNV